MQPLKVLTNKGVAGRNDLKFPRSSAKIAFMQNPPQNGDFQARWQAYLRQQSQVGYEKLWLMGLGAATLVTGVGMWLLLSSK